MKNEMFTTKQNDFMKNTYCSKTVFLWKLEDHWKPKLFGFSLRTHRRYALLTKTKEIRDLLALEKVFHSRTNLLELRGLQFKFHSTFTVAWSLPSVVYKLFSYSIPGFFTDNGFPILSLWEHNTEIFHLNPISNCYVLGKLWVKSGVFIR